MILGLMDVRFSHTLSLSLSIIQFSRWVIDVNQEMSTLEDLWRSVGALCCANSFLVLGNENGVVSLGRFGGFREMKGKTNHAVHPLVRNLTVMF